MCEQNEKNDVVLQGGCNITNGMLTNDELEMKHANEQVRRPDVNYHDIVLTLNTRHDEQLQIHTFICMHSCCWYKFGRVVSRMCSIIEANRSSRLIY